MGDARNRAFGERVRVAMAVARLSRVSLARECGVTPQAIQKWCDGTAMPTSGNLMTLARLSGASLEWLMWPHPVDIRTTEWAINGTHIRNIVRTVLDEIAPAPPEEPAP